METSHLKFPIEIIIFSENSFDDQFYTYRLKSHNNFEICFLLKKYFQDVKKLEKLTGTLMRATLSQEWRFLKKWGKIDDFKNPPEFIPTSNKSNLITGKICPSCNSHSFFLFPYYFPKKRLGTTMSRKIWLFSFST